LDELRRSLEDVILPHMPIAGRFALLDYPNHENVGDSAIWSGERAFLKAHGREVVYVADLQSYSESGLRRNLGSEGVILFHGGGNFGDLYPHHQQHRERVIGTFADHPIIQLPQTATFRKDNNAARAREVYARHLNLTLILRDSSSLAYARTHFVNDSALAPDLALALTPEPADSRSGTILWLARTDDESADPSGRVDTATQVAVVDWVGKRSASPYVVARRIGLLAMGSLHARLPATLSPLQPWIERSFDELARRRVEYGYRLLRSARVLVTDRLHGHILALLLGVPHVLLNDRYDKVGRFYRTWSFGNPLVKFAATPAEALAAAGEFKDHPGR